MLLLLIQSFYKVNYCSTISTNNFQNNTSKIQLRTTRMLNLTTKKQVKENNKSSNNLADETYLTVKRRVDSLVQETEVDIVNRRDQDADEIQSTLDERKRNFQSFTSDRLSLLVTFNEQGLKLDDLLTKILTSVDHEVSKLKTVDKQKNDLNSFLTKCENETKIEIEKLVTRG